MNKKKKKKVLKLMMVIAILLLSQFQVNAQGGGVFHRGSVSDAACDGGMMGRGTNGGFSLSNQQFGSDVNGGYNLTNQTFGQDAPLGSGFVILTMAGMGYVAFKRRQKTDVNRIKNVSSKKERNKQ